MTVWLRREPVLNPQRAVVALRLRLCAERDGEAHTELAGLADAWPEARTVILGVEGKIPEAALCARRPTENTMLEFRGDDLANSPALRALAEQVAADGSPLCLGGFRPGLPASPFTPRFILAEPGLPFPATEPAAPLLATGLADPEAFDAAMATGYSGAAGWFFLHGSPPDSGMLNPGHARIIRVLNLVRRNAEVDEVEAALKQDLGISFKLLRYINSAGFGVTRRIESFRHAVTLIGYNKLNKWLSLLLVSASDDPAAAALMQTAVVRGRFMELIAHGRVDGALLDHLFVVGSFSLLDILLGTRLDAVLAELDLPEAIASALLRNEGPCAPWLELARTCEEGGNAGLAARAAALGLDASGINRAQLEALAFADNLEIE
jgi:EAL and modified HD-GYP domain-containing signal transduction protein